MGVRRHCTVYCLDIIYSNQPRLWLLRQGRSNNELRHRPGSLVQPQPKVVVQEWPPRTGITVQDAENQASRRSFRKENNFGQGRVSSWEEETVKNFETENYSFFCLVRLFLYPLAYLADFTTPILIIVKCIWQWQCIQLLHVYICIPRISMVK